MNIPITKICTKCKIVKSEDSFSFKDKKRGILSSNCKSCQKIIKDKHYIDNKQHYLNRNKKRKDEKKIWWNNIKKNLSCKNCGETHIAVLDFHHRDPKKKDFTISSCYKTHSEEKILLELEKCDVLCSNCHRILHWNMDHSSNG